MSSDDNTPDDESTLPGAATPVWLATTPKTNYSPLDEPVRVDTAIVGGGIAGLTTAAELAEAGLEVAVLERDRIVESVTAHTTAKLTSQHGLKYDRLTSEHGREAARAYGEANEAAIDRVEERVEEWGIDCDFRRVPHYVYTESRRERRSFRSETDAARRAGLPASFTSDVPLSENAVAAVRFDDQARFHPRAFLLALAEQLVEDGGEIFERTRVTDVDPGDPCRLRTERGTVVADSVVVATHFPMRDEVGYFARIYPKRSYVLGARVDEPPEERMYLRSGSPYFSVRTAETPDGTMTLVGGQDHKTGQGNSTKKHYRALEREARRHFDVKEVEYRWSTQDYFSADGVPFIGRIGPFSKNVYVATGFGGWGMTGGTLSGLILSDLVRGQENPWADLFDPLRVTPRASMREFLSENANVAKEFVGNWVTESRRRAAGSLATGEATVLREGRRPLGVYRDVDGDLHAVSAVCPHMKCIVRWNDAERTWDCPCHGSRFAYDGRVLDGPAVEDLPTRNLDLDPD